MQQTSSAAVRPRPPHPGDKRRKAASRGVWRRSSFSVGAGAQVQATRAPIGTCASGRRPACVPGTHCAGTSRSGADPTQNCSLAHSHASGSAAADTAFRSKRPAQLVRHSGASVATAVSMGSEDRHLCLCPSVCWTTGRQFLGHFVTGLIDALLPESNRPLVVLFDPVWLSGITQT
jgi:hypothetical protein